MEWYIRVCRYCISELYTVFLHFQSEGPMIHVLFTELRNFPKRSWSDFLKVVWLMAKVPNITWLDIQKKKKIHLMLEKNDQTRKNEEMLDFYIATTKQLHRLLTPNITWPGYSEGEENSKKRECVLFVMLQPSSFKDVYCCRIQLFLTVAAYTQFPSLVILEHWQKQFPSLFQRQTFQQQKTSGNSIWQRKAPTYL